MNERNLKDQFETSFLARVDGKFDPSLECVCANCRAGSELRMKI